MEKINSKLFKTGHACRVCGTEVTELVSLKNGNELGRDINIYITSPMMWVNSDYISCPQCSIQYGKPNVLSILEKNPERAEHLKWELSLYKAMLKRSITIDDFLLKPEDGVPIEITALKIGDIIFIDENSIDDSLFKGYRKVRLLAKKDVPTYMLSGNCFE